LTTSLLDLTEMLESWQLALRGERKSAETLKAYRAGVTAYVEHCEAEGIPVELTKANVVSWMATLADREAATARLRLTAVKRFALWLSEEEGIDVDGVLTVRAPKLDEKVVDHLSDKAVQALVAACAGDEFRDRRDKALVVLFTETGLRASEMLSLDVADISLADCTLTVRRGKGAKGRRSRFSPQCAAVLDKYIRARRRAGNGSEGALWVGTHGRLSYSGLTAALRKRAEAAGVAGFHLHRLRHTTAVRWLRAGGTETGLMAQAGWKSRKQIDRYVKSAAESLASDEFDRLGLAVAD
jgi:integrase/recombinase XerD